MRVLLYLPVVTPWWFEQIVKPIVQRLVGTVDVHILAPIPWENTGIGPDQIYACRNLPQIYWHIIDDPSHTDLRPGGTATRDDLLAFVRRLAPDLTLCRSADFQTAYQFPGIVRFLMEVAASPFHCAPSTATITDRPFSNGTTAELTAAETRRLDDLIDPLWREMRLHCETAIPDRTAVHEALRISDELPMMLMPLEYEHGENFFNDHYAGTGTFAMIAEVARTFPDWHVIVTDHPLNNLNIGRLSLREAIPTLGRNVILSPPKIGDVSATLCLARHANGMVLGNSKSFGFGALFSVPMMRRSVFASADWLVCETDLDVFKTSATAGNARAPSQSDARRWFAYHLANEAFNPSDPDLGADEIVDRMARTVNPDRWESAIGRMLAVKREAIQ